MSTLPLSQQNIIAILGIQSLPEEKRLAILDKISNLIQKRLLVRIYEFLPDSLHNQFGQLLESGESVKLSAFLKKHTPDLMAWTEEETTQLKKELANWSESI